MSYTECFTIWYSIYTVFFSVWDLFVKHSASVWGWGKLGNSVFSENPIIKHETESFTKPHSKYQIPYLWRHLFLSNFYLDITTLMTVCVGGCVVSSSPPAVIMVKVWYVIIHWIQITKKWHISGTEKRKKGQKTVDDCPLPIDSVIA